MDINNIITNRLLELVKITNILSVETSEFKSKSESLMEKIKNTEDLEQNKVYAMELIKESTLAYMKSQEVGINIRIMNELYSFTKFMEIDVPLEEKDLQILEFNLSHVKPTFILHKGEVIFFDTEVQDLVNAEFNKPRPDIEMYINNIKNMKNG